MENIFCRKVRYSKHQRNSFPKDCNFTRVFDFPPSDLMRPRYCRSADARMRMQNALLLALSAANVWPNYKGVTCSYPHDFAVLWSTHEALKYDEVNWNRCMHMMWPASQPTIGKTIDAKQLWCAFVMNTFTHQTENGEWYWREWLICMWSSRATHAVHGALCLSRSVKF